MADKIIQLKDKQGNNLYPLGVSDNKGGGEWGTIKGNIDDQTDLKDELDKKVSVTDDVAYIGQEGAGTIPLINTQDIADDAITEDKVDWASVMNKIYPIGSIYMSTVGTSPQTFIGGTWERIKDTFFLASGDTYSAGSSGGAATHTHNYGISYKPYYGAAVGGDNDAIRTCKYDTNNTRTLIGVTTSQSASNVRTNNNLGTATKNTTPSEQISESNTSYTSNLPPYISVYVWKRTA